MTISPLNDCLAVLAARVAWQKQRHIIISSHDCWTNTYLSTDIQCMYMLMYVAKWGQVCMCAWDILCLFTYNSNILLVLQMLLSHSWRGTIHVGITSGVQSLLLTLYVRQKVHNYVVCKLYWAIRSLYVRQKNTFIRGLHEHSDWIWVPTIIKPHPWS